MSVADLQIDLLGKAAEHLEQEKITPYFRLCELLPGTGPDSRREFERTFCRFYGLNAGGLTDAFRQRYFDLLFGMNLSPGMQPPYEKLLLELHPIRRRKGDQVLPVSFVSKLIAMRDDSRPLFDRHVRNFFGVGVPALGSLSFRIKGFIGNLESIRQTYIAWESRKDFQEIRLSLLRRIPALADCHVVRICDFLVWTAGRERIDMPPRSKKRRAKRS